MKVDLIISCDRCREKFLLPGENVNRSYASRFDIDHKATRFDPEKGPVTLHKYVSGLDRDSYYVQLESTKATGLCAKCDAAYWENFEKASTILADFWALFRANPTEGKNETS
jgi:hypothetical protein